MKNETTNRNIVPVIRPILALNGAYFLRDSNGYVVTEAPRQSRYYTEYTRYH